MPLKPNFKAKDLEQLTYHLLRVNDNKTNNMVQPIVDQLRRLNVVDNINPDKIKKQSKKREELLYQCHLFIKQNKEFIKMKEV